MARSFAFASIVSVTASTFPPSSSMLRGTNRTSVSDQNIRNVTLKASELDWTDCKCDGATDCFDLNGGQGPWCPSYAVPARVVPGRGWDPCCSYGGCNIFDAVWDQDGNEWCKWDAGAGACSGPWDGGFVYDTCPCSDEDWYNCDVNDDRGIGRGPYKKARCIPSATSRQQDDTEMLNMCGEGRDVCNCAYLQAPACSWQYHDGADAVGEEVCVPNWQN